MIGYLDSGTQVILRFFEDCDVVIVPDNLCKTVTIELSKITKIKLAHTNKFDTADYIEHVKQSGCRTGLLFVHSYGLLNVNNRDAVWSECKKRSIKFIDDFCLASPQVFLDNSLHTESQNYLSIISFGYSKVVDLGGGALVMGQSEIVSSICRSRDNVMSLMHKDRSICEAFLNYIKHIEKSRLNRSLKLRASLRRIFQNELFIDTNWRFNVLVDKNTKLYSKLKSTFPVGLFWGNNYGKLKLLNDNMVQNYDDLDYEIFNFFHDFRVDCYYVENLRNYLICE